MILTTDQLMQIRQDFINEVGETTAMKVLASIVAVQRVFAKTCRDTEKPVKEQLEDFFTEFKKLDGMDYNEDIQGILDGETGTFSIETKSNDMTIFADLFVETDKSEFRETDLLKLSNYVEITVDYDKLNKEKIFEVIISDLAIALRGKLLQLQVNNNKVNGNTFVYDGCHKLYVISDDEDRAKAREYGYIVDGSTEDSEIEHDIAVLEEYYYNSCPLRFIDHFNFKTPILPQCEQYPVFIYY